MKTRPRLNFWQIWNMSFGFLGIQFGFALQNANVSRVFETLGAAVEVIPLLWIAAPVTGLLVQPIVGYMSDNTWSRLGRRRPFFLYGAIVSAIALLLFPMSPLLWIAVGIFWVLGVSIDMCMQPYRAFVGDMLPPDQRNKGFAMQSFFIGTGSVVASMLPWLLTEFLNVPNTHPEGNIPPSVIVSFIIGGGVFFLAVLWTVLRTKEYSPEELRHFEELEKGAERVKEDHKAGEILPFEKFTKPAKYWIALGAILTAIVYRFDFIKSDLYIITIGLILLGITLYVAGHLIKRNRSKNGFVIILNDLFTMPKTMGQLAVAQFFIWVGLFTLWTFATPGITSHHYDMKINEAHLDKMFAVIENINNQDDTELYRRAIAVREDLYEYRTLFAEGETEVSIPISMVGFFQKVDAQYVPALLTERLIHIEAEFNRGANWVGVLFGAYNGFAALIAFLLPLIARWTNRRYTLAMALVLGGLGYLSIVYVPGPEWLILSMVGIGIAWASILALPYAILTGCLPSHKMGTYMGLFNIFIVIPQIVAASILGSFIILVAKGEPIYAMIFGGVSLFLGALAVVFIVKDPEEKLNK